MFYKAAAGLSKQIDEDAILCRQLLHINGHAKFSIGSQTDLYDISQSTTVKSDRNHIF